MTNEVQRLRDALERGLGPHHDVDGECAVRIGEISVSLFLRPGVVNVGPTNSPRGTLILDAALLDEILTGTAFDFRFSPYRERLRFEGDVEFVIRNVVLSLRQPPEELSTAFKQLESAPAKECTSVERVPHDELCSRLVLGVPFIVNGALDHWPAVKDFDAWLSARAAVSLQTLQGNSVSLADFVQRTERDVHSYTHGFPLPETLWPDFGRPRNVELDLSVPQLWMGSGRDSSTPVTALHRDVALGLLGHVHGRTRFTVYAPHFAPCLYPRPGFDTYQQCWVSPHAPDFERYPLFRDARGIDFELEPGDLLVQPPGWFHCVYALTPLTASVSYFA